MRHDSRCPIPSRPFTRHRLGIFLAGVLGVLGTLMPGARIQAQVSGAMDVWPRNTTVEIGTSRQFGAYVPINPNTIVWLVNDIPGGNAILGTISTSGKYQAPAVAPTNNVLTITARSTAFPTSSASTPLTVTRKYPWLWSTYPSALQTGAYEVSFNGANFAPDSVALANGQPVNTTYVSPTKLIVRGMASQAGTLQFAVRQPAPGAVTGNSVSVQVSMPTVTVAVSPATASIQLGASQPFTATVTGSANTAVTWSVNGVPGGSSATGTISPAGVYTAPASMPSPATVSIRATSVAAPTAYATASVTLTAPPPVTVAVSPATASVQLVASQPFTATVTGSANTAVTWSVNGVPGGSGTTGTISPAGVYTAPASMPSPATVSIRATSVAAPTAYATASVTLTAPPPVTVAVSPATASVQLGASQAFTATVTGSANTAVTWSVNGVPGGSGATGTISPAGVYTAPVSMPSPATVSIRATSVAAPASFAEAAVTLVPVPEVPPSPGRLAAARFLEQSSFGPTPGTLAEVEQAGIDAYLDGQFALPETPIPTPSGNSLGGLRQWMLHHYTSAPDQLRQRVAYSLSQIVVTSGTKLVYADEMLPWLRLLSQHAFGNYRDLLRDVTRSPSMGKFLDLANSMKPGAGSGANENYPRELLQLFTLGLRELNPNGSIKTNAAGQPIPTYDQETVRQVALALTGWTYATAPGAEPRANNWEYFGAPMESRAQNHDPGPKTFLGCSLPAGQTVEQDLESVLDCLMNHPNLAPFVATRLIRSLVKSNPSGDYIQRVAGVFSDNGSGVRGDLKAVVRAILKDPEARNDTAGPEDGRLKEPILHAAGFLRALNGGFNSGQQVTYLFDYMGQAVLAPPSVFSWFSPLYRVPGSTLYGPEFQIYTPTEATLRGNLFHYILGGSGGDITIDLSPFQPYGNDMPGLVEKVNQALLFGRMPAGMKPALITAATPGYDAKTRIETVLYLTALSGQFAVQH